MRHNKFICAVTALAMTLGVCRAVLPSPTSTVSAAGSATVVRLDPSEASPFNDGKFEGWGTSMGWWGNRIGHSDKMAQQAAEDLYSEDGLGLDIVRYNVGGGDNPTHNHINRSDSKLPCFAVPQYEGGEYQAAGDKNADVTNLKKDDNGDVVYDWDWDADHDQINVLKRIKEQNPDVHIEGYTNSPPWFMTKSQCSSGGDDEKENLDPSNYDVFADFLVEVTKHMEEIGLPFDSYSPMNEPSTNTDYWRALSNKQEGNLVAPGEHQSGIIKALKDAYKAKNIDTLVAGPDETDLGYTISSVNALTEEGKAALDRIDTHTYGGSNRAGVKRIAEEANKNLWMSEVDESWDGFGLADRIITDLNGMQASAWVMWDIIDSHRDANFVDPTTGNKTEAGRTLSVTGSLWGVGMGNHDTETVEWANKYYAYGQFTRYINPGDTLIASSNKTLAAYNKDTGAIKVVVNNSGSSDIPYEIDLSAFTSIGGVVTEIRSNNLTGDAAEHWKEITGEAAIADKKLTTTAKAGTITTYVISGAENFEDKYAIITGGGNELGVKASVQLALKTNIEGSVTWAVDNNETAEITQNGLLTTKTSGTVTVTATVGDYSVSRTFNIPPYKLSGTPSWGSASSAPADSADYRKAADGDLSTYFDGVANGWVMYDYGEPYKISEIKLAARSGDGMAARTAGAKIQASNDAINWTDLYTIQTAIPADAYTTVTADKLANDKAYRYYRYTNPAEMTNIAEFQIEGAASADTPANDPVVKDIAEFTDNFEGSENIFGGTVGELANGKIIYASGLERFGNVFVPVNTTASSELAEPITLTDKQLFRIQFNMFAGWEQNGKDNTFAIKDKDGNEIVAMYLTGGGYNLNQLRIGGQNVLASPTVSQSRTAPSGSKTGANGWDSADQPYRNTMGYNKTCEILIDGAGKVSVSFTGGMADTTATGTLTSPVSIKSIEATGACNTSAGRVASYDNLDADLITYQTAFETPAPATPTPDPADKPQIPADGTLISLNFDNGDLTSGSAYGKASGTPLFAEVDGRKAAQFNNTASTVITLTDAEGGPLLAGQEEITVSFDFKPTNSSVASWWFFAAPNANEQTYQQEHYLGALSNTALSIERYNGGGSRAEANNGAIKVNEWNSVVISFAQDKTTLYVDGEMVSEVASSFKLSDILGTAPVAYIGRANWTTGEYATGYIDNFVIKKGTYSTILGGIDLGDTSAVKKDIEIPEIEGVTWSSSNPDVVSADGKVTRGDDTVTVTLTAKNGDDTRDFAVTVIGLTAFADTFTAYADGNSIKFTADAEEDNPYKCITALYDGNGTLLGVKNAYEGAFENLENGTYKASFFLWNSLEGMVPKHGKVTKTVMIGEEIQTSAYLFAHFVGNESSADHEQIYFSVSQDGTTWKTLNGGKPVLKSEVGEKGVRDPYILRGENGKFYIIATDLSIYHNKDWGRAQNAGSKSIVVWESTDLVNWSDANLVKVAVDNAGCTWAPEAVYDADKGQYMVFWASKISDDNYSVQRMYRSYTSDFKTFSAPEIYIDGGTISNIDTTIVEENGVYYRFTKNESKSSVTMMKSEHLDGPWTDVDTYTLNGVAGNTVTGYEGPTIYKDNASDKWTLLLDYYSKSQGYKPFVTDNLAEGHFTSAADFQFDATYRHGTVMPITQDEYDALIANYPNS